MGRERRLSLPVGRPLPARADRRIDRGARAGRGDGAGPGSRAGRRADLRPAASVPRPAGACLHRRPVARGVVGTRHRRSGRRGRGRRRGGPRGVRDAGAAVPRLSGFAGPQGVRAAGRRRDDRSADPGAGPHLDARVLRPRRLGLAPAPLVRRLLLPRRLRLHARHHVGLGGVALFLRAPRRRRVPDLARGQRPHRPAPAGPHRGPRPHRHAGLPGKADRGRTARGLGGRRLADRSRGGRLRDGRRRRHRRAGHWRRDDGAVPGPPVHLRPAPLHGAPRHRRLRAGRNRGVHLFTVDGRQPDGRSAAGGCGVGQRALRQPVARLRGRDPPGPADDDGTQRAHLLPAPRGGEPRDGPGVDAGAGVARLGVADPRRPRAGPPRHRVDS